jgi:hypothetical protein
MRCHRCKIYFGSLTPALLVEWLSIAQQIYLFQLFPLLDFQPFVAIDAYPAVKTSRQTLRPGRGARSRTPEIKEMGISRQLAGPSQRLPGQKVYVLVRLRKFES